MTKMTKAISIAVIIALMACTEETIAVWVVELIGQVSLRPPSDNPRDTPYAVHVSEQYAYVVDVNGGLYVIDTSIPGNPRQVGYCNRDRTVLHPHITSRTIEERLFAASGVHVKGNYAYLVDDGYGGLRVIDVSDPSKPREVGCSERRLDARAIHVVENHAYVACGGLHVFDVSDPSKPREVGICEIPWWTTGVDVADGYAYVTNGRGDGGLWIIDISNPEKPRKVGYCKTSANAKGVDVVGDYAYVICTKGLHVIDVSNRNNPHEVGVLLHTYNTYPPNGLYVESDHAYVAYGLGGKGGLQIIDVSNPTTPKQVGTCHTIGAARGVHVVGSYAYVVSSVGGLCIIKAEPDMRR